MNCRHPSIERHLHMFKKTLAAVAAAGIVAAPLAVVSPAEADSPGCVTRAEFRGVKKGWHRDRVTARFDTAGRIDFQSGNYVSREYRACRNPRYSSISVTFIAQRVDSKSAYWF